MLRVALAALIGLFAAALPCPPSAQAGEPNKIFRGGAAVIDITPTNFPVIVNAMFEERSATNAFDPLHVRCLVLDDGTERIVIAVVDSCMLPRDLIDEAKEAASKATGIPTDRMLVSATHTHSAPSAMGCLGSRADPRYARFLPERIVQAIKQAVTNLAPARIGWAVADDPEHTFCRRWIRRSDKLLTDPFGERNVRANMHPGHQTPDAIAPSGPVDSGLAVVSVQTPDGKPVALLANYSMHYYESPLLSADYYGVFANKMAKLIGLESGNGPFVAIMSQGTSGDQMWMDYSKPRRVVGLDAYADGVAHYAFKAYQKIEYRDWVPLVMREAKLALRFRVANEQRMKWARDIVEKLGDRLPRGMAEIYAKEQIYLFERPQAELKLQALRIGDLGITAIPNEVYGITGLKLKAQSPLQPTFNIELANGSEGYIPPPEQHWLGGYTTWAARTAGLETNAEPRIVESVLKLLEEVAGKPRREINDSPGSYTQAILASQPQAYWRLNEFGGLTARDVSGHGHHATYESGVAFYLEGPSSRRFAGEGVINRAPHLAGARLKATVPAGRHYSVELWFWNGLVNDARGVTGYLFNRVADGDTLAIGGTNGSSGKLIFGGWAGRTTIKPRMWNHVVFVRHEAKVIVYLNGERTPEIVAPNSFVATADLSQWFIGGRGDNAANFEGKIDEVAIYARALSADEVAQHFKESDETAP
jgi:hypothetical protein